MIYSYDITERGFTERVSFTDASEMCATIFAIRQLKADTQFEAVRQERVINDLAMAIGRVARGYEPTELAFKDDEASVIDDALVRLKSRPAETLASGHVQYQAQARFMIEHAIAVGFDVETDAMQRSSADRNG